MKNIYLLLFLLLFCRSSAQWNYNPYEANVIAGGPANQNTHTPSKKNTIRNLSGDYITIFRNGNDNNGYDIYGQKVSADGYKLWGGTGKMIFDVSENGSSVDAADAQIINDSENGAYISFTMYSGGMRELFIIRIDDEGEMVWSEKLQLTNSTNTDYNTDNADNFHTLVSDGTGGAYLAWGNTTKPAATRYRHVKIQRVFPDGSKAWADPVHIETLTYTDPSSTPSPASITMSISVLPDQSAVVSWFDSDGLFANRIATDGSILWGANGVTVDSGNLAGTHKELYARFAPTSDGTFISYVKDNTLYSNFITNSGTLNFPAPLVLEEDYNWPSDVMNNRFDITADGADMVLFYTSNYSATYKPTIQKIDATGNKLFGDIGIQISEPACVQAYTEEFLKVTKTSGGNYLAVWVSLPYIKSQKISPSGTLLHSEPETLLITNASNAIFGSPNLVADDSNGGALTFWTKIVVGTAGGDICMVKISGEGNPHWVRFKNGTVNIEMITADGILYTAEDIPLANLASTFSYDGQTYGIPTFPAGTAVCGNISYSPAVATYDITFDAVTKAYTFSSPLKIGENIKSPIRVYPNPIADNLYWDGGESFDLVISDMQGKTVMSRKNVSSPVNMPEIAKGFYLLSLKNGNRTLITKLIK